MNTAPGTLAVFARHGGITSPPRIANDYVAAQLRALYPPDRLLLIWGEQGKAVPLATGYECQRRLGQPNVLAVIPERQSRALYRTTGGF